jgi:hypothetical protein
MTIQMKNYLTAVVLFLDVLISAHGLAQFTNNGATITIKNGATLYTSRGLQNSSAGNITNNGALVSDSFVTNNSGCTFSGNGIYNVQGNWKNSGTFTPGTSKLVFFGKGNSDMTSGGASVYDLQLNKKANGIVSLKDAFKVLHSVEFLVTQNWVQLNKNILTLDSGCTIIGYNNKKYFITNDTGFLRKLELGNTKFTFPVGFNKSTYNPLSITETGTADNYSVRCLQHAYLNGGTGSAITHGGIDVSWLVRQGVGSGMNATIEAQWYPANGDQLAGFDSSKCMVVRYNGTAWDYNAGMAGLASGTTALTKKRVGITSVGYFTVLSTANPTLQNSITTINSEDLLRYKPGDVQILVYPTIVQNSVNISIRKNDENIQKMNVTIMDVTGKMVWQKQKIGFQSQQLLLHNLSAGVYMMLIEYGNHIHNQEIIVSQ